MNIETRRKTQAILQVLRQHGKPLGSIQLAEALREEGVHLNARMIRNYLKMTDEAGFTENLGRRGRQITELGRNEVESSMAIDKVGVVAARIDEYAYRLTFDQYSCLGTIVLNVSVVNEFHLDSAIALMTEVMEAGLGIGKLGVIARSGETLAGVQVPLGKVAIGTVSTITLNGILLKIGIPIVSRFGGLLEYRHGQPLRMLHFISYEGSTLDPFEVFSGSRMTNVIGATRDGNGVIGVSFREVPATALSHLQDTNRRLEQIGLGGVIKIGEPHQPLFDIPVRRGSVGMIVAAGLNPAAALQESGISNENIAMAGLHEFSKLTDLKSERRSRWAAPPR